ncbi:MAG: hypothetical protein ACLQUY_12270 [Ktedonobacterales bacterium]
MASLPSGGDGAYTPEHQSGTENDVTVTIKPAPGVQIPAIDARVVAQQSDLTWKLAPK